jgi:hypothetical protein
VASTQFQLLRLLLFRPTGFFTAEAAQQANVLALSAVQNRNRPRGAAAMITRITMMRRLAPPGLTLTQQIAHGTLL